MEFIEAPAFTRHLADYLSDDAYKGLQTFLADQPEAGDVIQGTGGFRKLRRSDGRRGKGKRGGLRVIYFHFAGESQIWLITIYDKSEADDLSAAQKKFLREAIEIEKTARQGRRNRR